MSHAESLALAITLARLTTLEIRRDIQQARADMIRQPASEMSGIRASVTGDRLRAERGILA